MQGTCFWFCFLLLLHGCQWHGQEDIQWFSAPGECPEWTDSGSSQSQLSDPLTVVLLTWTLCLLHGEPPVSVLTSFSSAYTTDGCFPWPLLCSCCWQSGSQCPPLPLYGPRQPNLENFTVPQAVCSHSFPDKVQTLALGKGPVPSVFLPWVVSLSPWVFFRVLFTHLYMLFPCNSFCM